VRLKDGHVECALCGEMIDVPLDAEPRIVVKAASGQTNRRTIVSEGRELHSCPVPSARDEERESSDA
jgi:hypothetical protein